MQDALLADSPLFVWPSREKPSLPMKADRPSACMPRVRGRTGGEPSPILVFCVEYQRMRNRWWCGERDESHLGGWWRWLLARGNRSLAARRAGSVPLRFTGLWTWVSLGSQVPAGQEENRSHRPTGPVTVRSSA